MNTEMTCFQKHENLFFKRIVLFVIFFHVCFLCFLGFQQTAKPLKKPNKKIAVRMVAVAHVEPVLKTAAAKESVSLQDTPITKQEETKKVEPVKKAVPKKEVKMAKPAVKKEAPVVLKEAPVVLKEAPKKESKETLEKKEKQKALIAAAKSNLAKANKTFSKKEDASSIALGPLSFEQEGKIGDTIWQLGYRDELASRLQSLLKFPEKGEVKIKLTLERSGKVLKLLIDSFESKKNRDYIEKTVKNLDFPSFQGDFNEFSEYTFSITLKG
ncbi:MAG TPA: hypothetical protein PLC42_01805 [Parachlamydiaceae bacterium]|nr:hypothetical protein [Parachlamydiaceae bacterium]